MAAAQSPSPGSRPYDARYINGMASTAPSGTNIFPLEYRPTRPLPSLGHDMDRSDGVQVPPPFNALPPYEQVRQQDQKVSSPPNFAIPAQHQTAYSPQSPYTPNPPPFQQGNGSHRQPSRISGPSRYQNHQQEPQRPPLEKPHNLVPRDPSSSDGCPNNNLRRKRREGRPASVARNSRSNSVDGFIGAVSIGILGDLILPGLGTVTGIAVGWLSGKEYAKRRKRREQTMERGKQL